MDRELLAFLEAQIVPALARDRRTRLLGAVQRAIRSHDPERLGALPERLRRELLGAVEIRLNGRHGAPSPGVVVRLVTALSALPSPDAGLGHLLATPAR
ncbi:MAG: hypothetical protein L3J87_01475 [Thermoplasmata archaeon]|nr:hypothetical protein [Thermoplasmata archaeon]